MEFDMPLNKETNQPKGPVIKCRLISHLPAFHHNVKHFRESCCVSTWKRYALTNPRRIKCWTDGKKKIKIKIKIRIKLSPSPQKRAECSSFQTTDECHCTLSLPYTLDLVDPFLLLSYCATPTISAPSYPPLLLRL